MAAEGHFRSHLERTVADELTRLGISWRYEQPVLLPNGASPRYLPDFTIDEAPTHFELPQWIECKPQQFIYSLRDFFPEITRQFGEYFDKPIAVADFGWHELLEAGFDELWKPKRLAELTGESVLIVGAVNATSRLSIEMRQDTIVFSRCQPFVNWAGIQKQNERKRRRIQWEKESEQRQRQWEAAQAMRRRQTLDAVLASRRIGPNKFAGHCCGCNAFVPQALGILYKASIVGGGYRFFAVCNNCHD